MNKIISFFKKNNFLATKVCVWLLIIYFPIFLNLGGLYMQKWDESRYGVSSYEMLHGSNPFVVTFLNKPSMDSPKPPLMHWLQAMSISAFGFNEMSVRLPSAFAGLLICLTLMYFSYKNFKSFSLGAITSLLLLTTPEGFCGVDHCVRTGDYDALLTLFSFLAIICFYQYNEKPHKQKYLFLTFVFLTFAVLTKAVAGLFFGPGILIYALVNKNLFSLFKNKWFYISLAFFVTVVGSILFIREYYNPGYLQALNEMEFLGRHNTVKDGHEGDFWFYLTHLKDRFSYFFLFIPFGWLIGLSCKDYKIRKVSLFTLILGVTFYLVLSTAQSKLQWYSFPLFPLLALQGGLLIWILLKNITNFLSAKIALNRLTLFYLSITLLFFGPYTKSLADSNEKVVPEWFSDYNNIQDYLKLERDVIRNAILVSSPKDSEGPYLFYYYKLNEEGFNLTYQTGYNENYQPGDKLIVEDPEIGNIIENNYYTKLLDQYRHLKVYGIIGRKFIGIPNDKNKIIFKSKRTINILAPNNKFLGVNEKKWGLIFADNQLPDTSATFTILTFGDNLCVIYSFANKYLSTNLAHIGELVACASYVSDWETFELVKLEGGFVAFKAYNGKYLSLDKKTQEIIAKASTAGENEKFTLKE